MIIRKSPAEIEKMAAAGAVHTKAMKLAESKIREGITTLEIDQAVEKLIRSHGGEPSFKGYHGFTGSICASPNSMVVHGIPGPYRLARGDILSVDIGVTLDGWVADGAVTFPVGPVAPIARKLLEVTRQSLLDAAEQCRPGKRLGDVSHAVQRCAESSGMSVVRSLVGHGIGRDMHEAPQIPNYGQPGRGPKLEVGMVLAVEPMINAGGHQVRLASDEWSIYSKDGSLAAHFEFTIAITPDGPRILTPWHEVVDAGAVPAAPS